MVLGQHLSRAIHSRRSGRFWRGKVVAFQLFLFSAHTKQQSSIVHRRDDKTNHFFPINCIRIQIRNLGFESRTCLDSPARKKDLKKAVGLYPCHSQGGNQVNAKFASTNFCEKKKLLIHTHTQTPKHQCWLNCCHAQMCSVKVLWFRPQMEMKTNESAPNCDERAPVACCPLLLLKMISCQFSSLHWLFYR